MNQLLLSMIALGLAATSSVRLQGHEQQLAARGHQAMEFDQAKTTLHLYLYEDGGAIELIVKDRKDAASLGAIRSHLTAIAQRFAAGDVAVPPFNQAQEVPGTEGLKRLRDRIVYASDDIRDGGRLRIRTRHARALLAVHEFLRFQIRDHKTGDLEHVTAERKIKN
jgi:hypothetical protein